MVYGKKAKMQLHFVGIGGIGMSGIAEVFLREGYRISGSDAAESDTTRRLQELGATIHLGHSSQHVQGSNVVVISSAIKPSNPEVIEATRLRIPVIPRAEMLGELMRGKTGIAVAGTHGKTSTTSMLATILTSAGLDPTLVIGGKVDLLGGNAKLGQGKYLVAEADESDGSFLHLPATYGIITNIDNDHLDHFGNLAAIENAFVDFVGKLPFYGIVAVCAEDPGVHRVLSRFKKPHVTYGFSNECQYAAIDIVSVGMGTKFEVTTKSPTTGAHERLGDIQLNIPGKHNVLNALATIVIARELGLSIEVIAAGLKAYQGVKRRFEIRWEDKATQRAIVDDYGHHPTEIAATLAAARGFWPGRIIAIFQPHRFSRTLHCHDGFLTAFHHADVVMMTDIYAAGEEPIDGVHASLLTSAIAKVALPHQKIHYVGDLSSACKKTLEYFKEGDLALCFGAGSITRLPEQLIEKL
ncbi:UDP-N-acetylmuramate--L-alanine ligase [Bdellovibrionota bacterium FG-2]